MARKMEKGLDGWETAPVRGGVPSSRAATPSCSIPSSAFGIISRNEVTPDSLVGEGSLSGFESTTTNSTAPRREAQEEEAEASAPHNAITTDAATTTTSRSLVYVYTQLYCGFCGRYITDIGGLVSASFAAAISDGAKSGPGADMLRHLPDCFREDLPFRSRSEVEKGPHGLSAAAQNLIPMEPLAAMTPDPRLPRLFLQPWLCFH